MENITRGQKVVLTSIFSIPIVIAISLMGLLALGDSLIDSPIRNRPLWREKMRTLEILVDVASLVFITMGCKLYSWIISVNYERHPTWKARFFPNVPVRREEKEQ